MTAPHGLRAVDYVLAMVSFTEKPGQVVPVPLVPAVYRSSRGSWVQDVATDADEDRVADSLMRSFVPNLIKHGFVVAVPDSKSQIEFAVLTDRGRRYVRERELDVMGALLFSREI